MNRSQPSSLLASLMSLASIQMPQTSSIDDGADDVSDTEIPTRLSCVRGDKGYKSNGKLQRYRVLFNGEEQFDCEVADVAEGYISRVTVRRHLHSGKQTLIRSGKIFGKVEILLKSA